ncbi:MAG: efflux RND transporter periplasmic adaptor subunit [Myxococcales bacterium]|nr:efflux RND transporter periplasmic adaptor subunit [Myxococcales bacterium]
MQRRLAVRGGARLSLMVSLVSFGCAGGGSGAPDAAPEAVREAPAVALGAATGVEMPVTLEVPASLLAARSVMVSPLAMGRVEAVLVERGQHVAEGAVLVRLRDIDPRRQVAAAEAALASARARLGGQSGLDQVPEVRAAESALVSAEDALGRAERVAPEGALSAQDLSRLREARDAARAQRDAARAGARALVASVEQARVSVEQARQGLTDVTVRAPFEGDVIDRHCEVGQWVSPDRGVIELAASTRLRVLFWLSPDEVSRVAVGARVEVWLDPAGQRRTGATVSLVGRAVDAERRAVRVEAWLENTPGASVLPGTRGVVRVETGRREARVEVPASALIERAGVWRVFVPRNGRFEERVVSVLDRHQGRAWLERGVAAGEQVALQPQGLADGMQVHR